MALHKPYGLCERTIKTLNIEMLEVEYWRDGAKIDPNDLLDCGVLLYELFEAHPDQFSSYDALNIARDLMQHGRRVVTVKGINVELRLVQVTTHDGDDFEEIKY